MNVERCRARSVVDDGQLAAVRDLSHTLHEVVSAVNDGMGAAVCSGDLALLLARDSSNHRGAQRRRPLAQDQPGPPCGRMDQDRVAALDLVDLREQHLRRHPLQHHGRGHVEADRLRKSQQPVRRYLAELLVADDTSIGNAVADLEVSNAQPTATTTPAPSTPGISGRGRGYRPVRW